MARRTKKERGVFERKVGSGVWWIRYADQFGRIHREKVGRRQTALYVYRQRKTEVLQGKFDPDLARRNASMSEIIADRYKEAKSLRAYKSERTYLNYWLDQLKDKPVRSVLPSDIEARRQELTARGLKPASVNRYLAALRKIFSLARKNGKAEKNPVSEVKFAKENNKRVRWLSDEEEGRLFQVLPSKYHDLVTVALHTGLRKTEELSLRWSDVDFHLEQITVRQSKSGESRVIPMNETVIARLKGLSKVRMIDNPYVFTGDLKGERQKDLPRYWEEYVKKAGIENFHWHDLRHTFASRLVMRGVDLYSVSKLLGHHDMKMTTRYAHLAPGYLKQAVSVLVQSRCTTDTKTGTF